MMRIDRKMALNAAIALIFILIAYRSRHTLYGFALVFIWAMCLCLISVPVCTWLERRGVRRGTASAATVLFFLFLITVMVTAFIPYLISNLIELIKQNGETISHIAARGSRILDGNEWKLGLFSVNTDMIAAAISKATAFLAKAGVALAGHVGRFLFSLVITYYLIRDREKLLNHLILCIPIGRRNLLASAAGACKNALLSYLSGVLKTGVFVGAATYLGLLLLNVKEALLFSVLMGIFEFLPYIGPVIASLPILLSVLPIGIERTLLVLLLIIAVQQAESNFIGPYFTASSTSIKPLSALLSVFILGNLFGVWGILLAVPALVLIQSLLCSFRKAQHIAKA